MLVLVLLPVGPVSAQYGKDKADSAYAYALSVKTAATEQRTRAEDKKTAALSMSQLATDGYLARSATMSLTQLWLFDDAMATASACYEVGDRCYDPGVLHFNAGNQDIVWGDSCYAEGNYFSAASFYSSYPIMGGGGGAATHYGYALDDWTYAEVAYQQMLLNYAIAYNQTNPP